MTHVITIFAYNIYVRYIRYIQSYNIYKIIKIIISKKYVKFKVHCKRKLWQKRENFLYILYLYIYICIKYFGYNDMLQWNILNINAIKCYQYYD